MSISNTIDNCWTKELVIVAMLSISGYIVVSSNDYKHDTELQLKSKELKILTLTKELQDLNNSYNALIGKAEYYKEGVNECRNKYKFIQHQPPKLVKA